MKSSFLRITTILLLVGVGIFSGCGANNPINAVRLNRQAQIYIDYGQYDRAIELLKASLDADFENSASHYWLGHCYEVQGNLTKTIQEYELSVRFDPSLDLAQLALIDTLEAMGRHEESIEAAKSYLHHRGGPAINLSNLANDFAQKQKDEHALLAYQRAQEVEPANAEPTIKLADYYFAKGDEEKGVKTLEAAFMIDPYYPGLARRLGGYNRRVDIPEPRGLPETTPLEKALRKLEE